MKAKISPLHIIDFAITNFEFDLVNLTVSQEELLSFFQKYEVDVDFEISAKDYIHVYIKAKINHVADPLPGYSINAGVTCIFHFDEQDALAEDVKNSLEGFSTIYIALNSLRGLISNFTANAPFGRYILPSIDLNDLIEQKKRSLEKKKQNKKNTGTAGKKKIKEK